MEGSIEVQGVASETQTSGTEERQRKKSEDVKLRYAPGESDCASSLNSGSKVMIALDHSSHSEETLHYYLKHVHHPENKVILTHVIELPENAHEAMRSGLSRETIAEMWSQRVTKAEQIEKKYTKLLQDAGVIHIHNRNDSGFKPGHALCHAAEQECVNMIVVGSRGEGKIRRTLLGSVSDYIVHHAHCPVLVCKYSKSKQKSSDKKKMYDKHDK